MHKPIGYRNGFGMRGRPDQPRSVTVRWRRNMVMLAAEVAR